MIRKKSLISILVFIVILFSVGCSSNKVDDESTVNSTEEDIIDIGLLIAGSDVCYNTAADVFISNGSNAGWNVMKYDSEYKASLEKATIKSLIAKKVDAIVLCTTDIAISGEIVEVCNENNIPIFYYMTSPNLPHGIEATSVSTTDWYMTGYLNAEYIANNYSNAKCVLIEGSYDQGMTELIRKGFIDGIDRVENNNVSIVANISGGWMKPNAYAVMEELISSEIEFDTIFTYNEDMMLGVIEYLTEHNLLGKYKLYAENGRDDVGMSYIKDGTMEASVEAPTTIEGDIVFQLVDAYLKGEEIPKHVIIPVKLLTSENVDEAISWNLEKYLEQKSSGEFIIDFHQLNNVEEERSWSTEGNNYESSLFHK